MEHHYLIATILVLTAILSVVNERFINMPLSIGVMAITVVASLLIILKKCKPCA